MQNYLQHKSTRIIFSTLFFVVGIGIFAQTAEALTYPYTLPTIPGALNTVNRPKYDALPSDGYRSDVGEKVEEYFSIDPGKAKRDKAVAAGNEWDKATIALSKWQARTLVPGTPEYTTTDIEGTTVHPAVPEHYADQPGYGCGYETFPCFNTTLYYPTLQAAIDAVTAKEAALVSREAQYLYSLNSQASTALQEVNAIITGLANDAATQLAQKTFDDCITAAAGDPNKEELCDTAKQAQLAEIEKIAGKTGAGTTATGAGETAGGVGTDLETAKELAKQQYESGPGGALMGPPPPQAAGYTQTAEELAAGAAYKTDLTADQQAKALALAANQEMSSPKEDELMAAIKAGCDKAVFFNMNCLAEVPYYFIYRPASWLMIIAGYMFDASLTLSINKSFVNQPFVLESWTVIRDFSNMLFIFILLYTGIMTIFGQTEWRKTVLNIVIIALLINFSLFFTKVVIDAGNILAVGIFQSMGATKTAETSIITTAMGSDVPERDLSASLVANFRPQKFLAKAGATDTWNTIIVFIIAAVVNVAVAYVLFKVALLFIGRLLAFWVLMILSPFALISFTLKGKANIFGWWTETLIGQAFVAPVFLFLLYLIMTVISAKDGIMFAFSK